jgi:hypothetical protein
MVIRRRSETQKTGAIFSLKKENISTEEEIAEIGRVKVSGCVIRAEIMLPMVSQLLEISVSFRSAWDEIRIGTSKSANIVLIGSANCELGILGCLNHLTEKLGMRGFPAKGV